MTDQAIVEYLPQYQWPVIHLIGRGLRDEQVIPESDEPIDDEDLYHIDQIYTSRSRFWVYLAGEQVIGTVAVLEMTPMTAQLKCMFVLAAHHGQGVGQRLLDHALAFARAYDYAEIALTTHPRMKRAHRFYERNGFQRTVTPGDLYAYRRDL